MPDLFEFPRVELDRDRIALFRTPFPKYDDAKIRQLAERLGVRGKVEDAGSRAIVRDRRSVLEVFLASDSVRWSTLHNTSSEAPADVRLPDEDGARKAAATFLRERKLSTQHASIDSLTYGMLSRVERESPEAQEVPIAIHVNYRFSLDRLPVLGPGAKIQVTFGDRSQVVEYYRFWRPPRKAGELELLPPEAAIRLLRSDPAYADLRRGSVVFHRAQLGYYALPPRESQGVLIPVYAFEGTVSTRQLRRFDFVRYVVAARFKPGDVKQQGSVFRSSGPVFS